MDMKKFVVSISSALALLGWGNVHALTAGQTYTISVEKINSNGTATTGSTSLGLSTTATADADGKIDFSFTSSLPTSSACNFLVISIKNDSGASVRDAIAPCPVSGRTVPLGVSGVTDKQTEALLAAFLAGATDDPIVAVFGFAMVRSGNMSTADIAAMADVCYQGLYNTGGFIDYLKTTRGVSEADLDVYRSNIVTQLGDSSSGYTKLMKDSVDATSASGSATNRGKAAGQVLKILITAADGVFEKDWVMEAFNSMGAIAVPLMQSKVSSNALSATGASMVNAGIGGGISKLQADRGIEKYSAAMTLMGASGADLTQFNTAVTALRTAMEAAFAQFEDVFAENDSGTNGSSATIDSDRSAMEVQMQTAFGNYMTAMAAENARITTMIANIVTALGNPGGVNAALTNAFNAGHMFKVHKNGGGTDNWPVNMVVLTDWVSGIKGATGDMVYSRDTVSIPATMIWRGVCSNSSYFDKASCEAVLATWTTGRTCFGASAGAGENGNCMSLPTPYSSLMAIQEDIMIREFTRFSAQGSAGNMHDREVLEKAFTDGLGTLAGNISGTTNGTTAISTAQKKAITTLMQSPQF